MNKIKISLNLLIAIPFFLGIAIGAGWAYQLSQEQLEIKKSLRQNPLQDVVLALAYIAKADGDLSDSEGAIIFPALQKLNIKNPAEIASLEKLIAYAKKNNLDVRQISYNIKKTNNPLLIRLLANVGNLITKDEETVASREIAMLADVLDYMGIKTDSNW